ncbi:MAG: transposase [Deltaproteobacteria bacterium]|nr:transposase [Deltaproteobacteria bacterium]
MARPLRIEFPGAFYHVTSRGNGRMAIFEDSCDQVLFLAVLAETVKKFRWLCHAYCLMNNHYHLLIETPKGNLSQGMRQLNGVYTQRFNRRTGRVGHLLQGRFKAILVDADNYLLELCRYIVLNPVRCGAVADPADYPWSSYLATAGRVKPPPFLQTERLLSQFDEDPEAAREAYRAFVREGVKSPSPWEQLKGQCLLGDEAFVEKMRPALEEKKDLEEIPRQERLLFRPPLAELLPDGLPRTDRDRAIARAHREYGFSQQEIGRRLGLHYSTVSRICRHPEKSAKSKT